MERSTNKVLPAAYHSTVKSSVLRFPGWVKRLYIKANTSDVGVGSPNIRNPGSNLTNVITTLTHGYHGGVNSLGPGRPQSGLGGHHFGFYVPKMPFEFFWTKPP